MVSLLDYLTWCSLGCYQTKQNFPKKCNALFALINQGIGYINSDDLYTNSIGYHSHVPFSLLFSDHPSSLLDIFEQTPDCLGFDQVATHWLNVHLPDLFSHGLNVPLLNRCEKGNPCSV